MRFFNIGIFPFLSVVALKLTPSILYANLESNIQIILDLILTKKQRNLKGRGQNLYNESFYPLPAVLLIQYVS